MARPLALTRATADKIVDLMRQGAFGEDAARASGVALSTYYMWTARGRDAATRRDAGEKLNDNDTRLAEFSEAVENARAEARVACIGEIRKAAQSGQWQAAAWYLERTAPKQFGRRLAIRPEWEDSIGEEGATDEDRIAEQLTAYLQGVREGAGVIEGEVVPREIEG